MTKDILRSKMDVAWSFVTKRLYHTETKLIYDYVSGKDGDKGFSHLPTPEEIKQNKPNVAGWQSGMEDCVLNGGSMLEAIIARYEMTKDENLRGLASDLFDGLYTCATVSKDKGFLARGVTPVDGKAHYINSSRDQYTHWLYMGVLFYRSPLATEEQKQKIREVLAAFAEKAERDVTPENDFALLREDGTPGIFCELYGDRMGSHESNRYPMFYMAAYMVTGNAHWLELYQACRDWALELAERLTEESMNKNPYCYGFLQMQYSLRLLYDGEEDAAYKRRYYDLMCFVAKGAYRYIRTALTDVDQLDYNGEILNWRMPVNINFTNNVFRTCRNAGEAIVIGCLCPDFKFTEQQCEDIEKLLASMRYEKANSYWPVPCCGAYWLYRLTQKK